MPRVSCVPDPENEFYRRLMRWHIDVCDGDHCAALLLSTFIDWHDFKITEAMKAVEANDIAEQHGDPRARDESLLQWHTAEQLENEILGMYEKKRISKAIDLLVAKGFISVHSNPNNRYKFDRTRYFLFNPKLVIEHLNEWKGNREVKKSPSRATKVTMVTTKGATNNTANNKQNSLPENTPPSEEQGTRSASGEAPRAAARPARAARPAWTGPTLRFRDTFEISSRMRRAGQEPPDYTSGRVYDYEGTDVMVTMDGMSESDLRAYLGLSPIDSPTRPPKETRNLNDGTPAFAAQPLLDVAPEPRPEPASEPKAKKGDPNQKHEACIAYHEIVRLRPNAAQAAEIAATVTNVERWKEVVKYWQLKGNKPNAVNGMLDCYRKGFVDPFAPDAIRAPGVEAKAQPQAPPPPKAKPAEIFPSWEQVEAWLKRKLAEPKLGPAIRLLIPPDLWRTAGTEIYDRIKRNPEDRWLELAKAAYDEMAEKREAF